MEPNQVKPTWIIKIKNREREYDSEPENSKDALPSPESPRLFDLCAKNLLLMNPNYGVLNLVF